MTTAFQSDAFQSDSFQALGGVTAAGGVDALSALGISAGPPTVGTPSLSIVSERIGGVAGGGYWLKVYDDGVDNLRWPRDIATGPPTLKRPALGEIESERPVVPLIPEHLHAESVSVAVPVIGRATFIQVHALSASGANTRARREEADIRDMLTIMKLLKAA